MLGDAFISELHSIHLKPRGFKKTRHTFIRSRDGYTEHYQIQGSAWNDREGPWTFYLNCGISFDGLPPRSPDRDFPRTHAWMRAQVFTAAPLPQSIRAETVPSDAAQVAEGFANAPNTFSAVTHPSAIATNTSATTPDFWPTPNFGTQM